MEYSFAKKKSERIWLLEQLKDFEMHNSPYIESRIGEYPIKDFEDEIHHRILLEEIEGGGEIEGHLLNNKDYVTLSIGFLSPFIKKRIM